MRQLFYCKMRQLLQIATVHTKSHKSIIDLFLTNRPLSFQKTKATETGIIDLLLLFLNLVILVQNPKLFIIEIIKILTRSFSLEILKIITLQLTLTIPKRTILISAGHKVVQKHAPVKQKILRGNHTPFINLGNLGKKYINIVV